LKRWLASAAVLVATQTACGTSSAALITNPCEYVSSADVSPIVGGPVSEGYLQAQMVEAGNPGPTCIFGRAADFTLRGSSGNGLVQYAAVSSIDDTVYQRWRGMSYPKGAVQPVWGIGDSAFEACGPHTAILFVTRGPYHVAFEVGAGMGEQIAPAEALAHIVVPRLGVPRVPLK